MSSKPSVGVIGLGGMGGGMAGRLLDTGYPVTVFNRSAGRAESLVAAGAVQASSPAELAAAVDLILVSVSDESAAQQVLYGRVGVLAGARPGTVVADSTTTSSAFARQVASRAAAVDVAALDLGVLGNPFHARTGESRILVGGYPEDYERVATVLADLSRDVRLLGAHGAASALKLALNMTMAAQITILAEAAALAERYGVDRDQVLDVLGSGGYSSPMLTFRCGLLKARRYEPAAFRTVLMAKDLELAVREAMALDVSVPVAAAITARLHEAVASGVGDLDVSSVVALGELEAGLGTWPADIAPPIPLHAGRVGR
jgi:3-hydroxyisobutyrate dehydrogenase-like beta-hydroxyacid dehydrogenase